MIRRVVDALTSATSVGGLVMCGPAEDVVQSSPELQTLTRQDGVRWIAPATSPASSVLAALDALPDDAPVLVTTADHALLRPEIVDHFVQEAVALDADVVAGVARLDRVLLEYPELKKTPHRLKDAGWCGCNLFLMKTTRGRRAPEYWRQIEVLRKRPWRAARLIGWGFLFRYLMRTMTLEVATGHIAERMGAQVRTVELPFAEAAVDVDSEHDWQVIRHAVAQT